MFAVWVFARALLADVRASPLLGVAARSRARGIWTVTTLLALRCEDTIALRTPGASTIALRPTSLGGWPPVPFQSRSGFWGRGCSIVRAVALRCRAAGLPLLSEDAPTGKEVTRLPETQKRRPS